MKKVVLIAASLVALICNIWAQEDTCSVHGIVTDSRSHNSIWNAIVSIQGEVYRQTSTDRNGLYSIENIPPGTYNIRFGQSPYYADTTINNFIINGQHEINMGLRGLKIVYFYIGGRFEDDVWHDTITINANQWLDMPVYFYGGPDVWVADMCYALGARYDIFDSLDEAGSSWDYWPFNGEGEPHPWSTAEICSYNDDVSNPDPSKRNPPGFHSLSFIGFARTLYPDATWLHAEAPIQILNFRVHVNSALPVSDTLLSNVLISGVDPIGGPPNAGDTLGGAGYPFNALYPIVRIPPLPNRARLEGIVTDIFGLPLESAEVTIFNDDSMYVRQDTTLGDGSYSFRDVPFNDYTIVFSKAGHVNTSFEDYSVRTLLVTLNAILYPEATDEVAIWYGHLDGSPISATIARNLFIDIYLQSDATSFGGSVHIPLALDSQYFTGMLSQTKGSFYYPFTQWQTAVFEGPFGSPPNPAGWISESLIAERGVMTSSPWLHLAVPTKIATFAAAVTTDSSYAGTTVPAIAVGAHPDGYPIGVGDTLTGDLYSNTLHINEIAFTLEAPRYAYLPGDANMIFGEWPPSLRGADVTFLVNYFRNMPINQPCKLDGFYASADVNGDCSVIGSDVTRSVNIYRGLAQRVYCPDYPPLWEEPIDVPVDQPVGWPGCE